MHHHLLSVSSEIWAQKLTCFTFTDVFDKFSSLSSFEGPWVVIQVLEQPRRVLGSVEKRVRHSDGQIGIVWIQIVGYAPHHVQVMGFIHLFTVHVKSVTESTANTGKSGLENKISVIFFQTTAAFFYGFFKQSHLAVARKDLFRKIAFYSPTRHFWHGFDQHPPRPVVDGHQNSDSCRAVGQLRVGRFSAVRISRPQKRWHCWNWWKSRWFA